MPDPDFYDSLDAPGLAQALERFFEVTTLVTNLGDTDEHGLPTRPNLDSLSQVNRHVDGCPARLRRPILWDL